MQLLFLFLFFCPLCCAIVLQPNPIQGINSIDNYANRQVYFFIQKNADESLTLQVGPPPYFASDATLLQTSAHIECETVIENFTIAELAGKKDIEIEFTVKAIPNINTLNGYYFYGAYQVGMISLDPGRAHYYRMQSVNISTPYSLNILYDENVNPDDGNFVIFSDFSQRVHWFSLDNGMLFSNSFTDNTLFKTRIPKTDFSRKFKLKVNISHIAAAAPGTYSMYFFFQMDSIDVTQTNDQTYEEIATYQVEGVNYVYNTIMTIVGDLQGTNSLYQPNTVEILNYETNKKILEMQYSAMLTAMTTQWDTFAALPNLSVTSQNIISQMQTFLVDAKARESDFSI